MSTALLLLAALGLPGGAALAAPVEVAQQGRITDDVGPLEGTHQVTFGLYTSSSGGEPLWSTTRSVDFTDGYFSVRLGTTTDLDDSVFDHAFLYLSVAVDGDPELLPRQRVTTTPFAARSRVASAFDGALLETEELIAGTVDAGEIRVDGRTVVDDQGRLVGAGQTLGSLTCSPDQIPVWSGDGWACGSRSEDAAEELGACDDGDLPIYDGSGERWGCLAASEAGLSAAEVIAAVEGADLDLQAGTTVGGDTVLQIVQADALSLAEGTTVDGRPIQTGAHSWTTLEDKPEVLADGDAYAVGRLDCAEGDVAVYSASFDAWGCLALSSEILSVVQAATLDLSPDTTFGLQTLPEVIESQPYDLDPATTAGGAPLARRGIGEGATYQVWGRASCGDDQLLYRGFMFRNDDDYSANDNALCIQGGDPGPSYSSTGDRLYTMEIANAGGADLTTNRALPCAVCLSARSPCYQVAGSRECAPGFSVRTGGFLFGAEQSDQGGERLCVDSAQEVPYENTDSQGRLYPTYMGWVDQEMRDLEGFPDQRMVKCATCCRD